ncbi:transposase InsO family protein [Bradyrhizobium sp. LM3.6]
MKFGFVAKHRRIWPAEWLCEALGVSRGGFYAWLTRPRSERSRTEEELGAKVRASFLASDRTYGARRVWHDLLAEGISCGLHRIERLMRLQALKARPRRRRLPPDLGERQIAAVAPNVLDRSFEAPAPNRKWIADFTYVWTAEGWLYVAAVVDLFSRRVVGWSMSTAMTAQLVTDALVMAIWRRGKPDALLHHSDRGSQYTSEQFQRLMADHGVVCSMSRSGNVWDNAAMESFFSSLKDRANSAQSVPVTQRGQGRRVRLHRALLQSEAKAFDDRISEPYGVRTEGWISLSRCQQNRVQLTFGIAWANSFLASGRSTLQSRQILAPSFDRLAISSYDLDRALTYELARLQNLAI